MMCDWSTKGIVPVVDIVRKPDKGGMFPGLFSHQLSQSCWTSDSQRVIISVKWASKQELVVVNVQTGEVTRLTNDDSVGGWSVLDIHNDLVLVSCSSISQPDYLMLGKLGESGMETDT